MYCHGQSKVSSLVAIVRIWVVLGPRIKNQILLKITVLSLSNNQLSSLSCRPGQHRCGLPLAWRPETPARDDLYSSSFLLYYSCPSHGHPTNGNREIDGNLRSVYLTQLISEINRVCSRVEIFKSFHHVTSRVHIWPALIQVLVCVHA